MKNLSGNVSFDQSDQEIAKKQKEKTNGNLSESKVPNNDQIHDLSKKTRKTAKKLLKEMNELYELSKDKHLYDSIAYLDSIESLLSSTENN